MEHLRQVVEYNQWLVCEFASPDAVAKYHQGDETALRPELHREIQRQKLLNASLVNGNQDPKEAAKLERTKSLIRAADEQTKSLGPIEQARARFSMFEELHHLFDLDNTLTKYDGRTTHQMFRGIFPASEWAELMLKDHAPDRSIFIPLFVASWQPALRRDPDLFANAATKIPIRPGTNEYFGVLKANPDKHKATILSGSFEPFVRRSLAQIPNADGFRVLSVPVDGPTITSIEKGVVIQNLVAADSEKGLVYYGDGESDIAALKAKDQIALFFALQGGSFHKACIEAGVLHIPFKDFNDVRQTMTAIAA
jgi:2-hydroxy-3-keto-5-methylthiopentenyl-1-phosphate phosphatase